MSDSSGGTTAGSPAQNARCVPLCAAGDKAPWWQHEVPCPVRQAHEAAKREVEQELTDDGK